MLVDVVPVEGAGLPDDDALHIDPVAAARREAFRTIRSSAEHVSNGTSPGNVKRVARATTDSINSSTAGDSDAPPGDGLNHSTTSPLRRLLRRYLRIAALALITGVFFAMLWTAFVLLLPAPRLRRPARNVIFRVWARICLRVIGGRIRVEGIPPRAPFLLVCNHLGYVDIPVLAACTEAWFVAKMEMRSWPLVGMLCRSVGTVFIDRKLSRDVLRVNRLIEDVLGDGYGVVLFPEGTSTQGFEVRRFRTSLLDHPARSGMPVHAAALSYRTPPGEPPAHLSVCWWGDAPLFAHAQRLFELRRFDVVVRFGSNAVTGSDRKELAADLHREVDRLFEPVVAPEERAFETGF